MRARWRSVSGLAYRASDAIEPHAQGRNVVLAHNRAASDRHGKKWWQVSRARVVAMGWLVHRRPRASCLAAMHHCGLDMSPRIQYGGVSHARVRVVLAAILRPFMIELQKRRTSGQVSICCAWLTAKPQGLSVRAGRNSARCGRVGLHHRCGARRSTRCWRCVNLGRTATWPAAGTLCAKSPELSSAYDLCVPRLQGVSDSERKTPQPRHPVQPELERA
jgi:hypothetical protein